MDAIAYYDRLKNQYASVPEGEPFALPIEELAEALGCTRRNAQLVLKKLEAEGYVEWRPGRGRGHQSRLAFLVSDRELLLRKAKTLVMRESLGEAWKVLGQLRADDSLNGQFEEWLAGLFGVRQDAERQDVLRFPFYRPVPALDPASVVSRAEAHWVMQMMNTLVAWSGKERRIVPQLAHAWESNDSCTEWTFYLRKGVRFHNGKLLTPEDVIHSFGRALNGPVCRWMGKVIASMRPAGKHGVSFSLNEPVSSFPHFICTEHYSIVPVGWNGENPGMPIGTGPFRIVKNNESMLAVEAHEHYYEGRPHLDRIEMWVWPNYQGELDRHIDERDMQLLYSEGQLNRGGYTRPVLKQLEQGSTYLTFKLNKPGPLRDERLRRALHYGLDRRRMVHELGGIRERPAAGFFIPSAEESADLEEEGGYDYDPERARELVAASSYEGETLSLYTYEMSIEDAEWMIREYGRLGIRMRMVKLPVEQPSSPAVLAQADMVLSGEVLGEQPDISMIETYSRDNGFVRNHLSPAERQALDRLISACLRAEDASSRLLLLTEWQETMKRACNVLFLYHSVQVAGHHRSLGGVAMNAWGKINYKDIWVRP